MTWNWEQQISNQLSRDPQGLGFLVALSGGADSVALLHSLNFAASTLGIKLIAVHIDHGLRENSPEDAKFCQELCAKLGVECLVYTLGPAPKKGSLEAWARAKRYEIFDQVMLHLQLDWIVTAHHLQDQRETLALRLERGTSLAGLRGILSLDPVRRLWRPWLGRSSGELREELRALGQDWREDESNLCLEFRRNFWRHRGLDALAGQGLKLQELDEIAQRAQSLHQRLLDWVFQTWTPAEITSLEWLKSFIADADFCVEVLTAIWPELGRERCAKWLERFAIEQDTGVRRWILSKEWEIVLEEGSLHLVSSPRQSIEKEGFSEQVLHLGSELSVEWAGMNYLFKTKYCPKGTSIESPFCTLLALDKTVSQLTLRTRRDGDYFSPAPLRASTRKFKKYLQESQVPILERESLLLVCLEQNVLWIPGRKTNGCFVPRESDQACWKLECYVTESRLERPK